MRIRTYSALAAVGALVAVAAPVAGADATPAAVSPPRAFLTFAPPRVGPISVDIGPTIINGKVTDPGLHVLMPGVSVPAMNWPIRLG